MYSLISSTKSGPQPELEIESCAKQQIEIDDQSRKRASAQILIDQHSYFRWWKAKLEENLILNR